MSKDYSLYSIEELRQELLGEQDKDNIQQILDLLNMHIKKKELIRVSKMSDLQDKVYQQMEARVDQRADCFSTKDLIDMYKVIDDSVNKSTSKVEEAKSIQPALVDNRKINIFMEDKLSREEKLEAANAAKSILAKMLSGQQDIVTEGEFVEVKDGQN